MNRRVELDEAQLERYSRQILVAGLGGRGQHRLLQAHVVVAGASETAVAIALSLGRAGVGHLYVSQPVAERWEERSCPNTRVIRYSTLLPSVASPAVLVDACLPHLTARDSSPIFPGNTPVLWARARGTLGLVGLWNGGFLRCTGWFSSFLPENCDPSQDEVFARYWVASLTSALVVRLISEAEKRLKSFLLRYNVAEGTVEEFTPLGTFRCDECGYRD